MGIFSTKRLTDIAVAEKEELKEPSQYDIIVHDNDYTSYEEVIMILSQAFDMNQNDALAIADKVNKEGKGKCGSFSKEVAEMKIILIGTLKESLVQLFPTRANEIRMLKFTVQKA